MTVMEAHTDIIRSWLKYTVLILNLYGLCTRNVRVLNLNGLWKCEVHANKKYTLITIGPPTQTIRSRLPKIYGPQLTPNYMYRNWPIFKRTIWKFSKYSRLIRLMYTTVYTKLFEPLAFLNLPCCKNIEIKTFGPQ